MIINGQFIDPKSNILDLLEASVTDRLSDRPVSYRAFLQALHEINVLSNFYVSGHNAGKWGKERRAVSRWKPY